MANVMNDYEFERLVEETANGLDAEHAAGEGPMMAGPLAGAEHGAAGSLFRQAMRGIRQQFGAIPWSKVAAVIAIVIKDISDGKDVSQIIADVVDALLSGRL